MNRLSLLILSILCLSIASNAQDSLRFEITEQSKKMSEGNRAALVLFVPEGDAGDTKDLWKEYMKEYDAKTKKGLFSSEYTTEEAHIYSVGGVNKVDVFATIDGRDGGVEVTAWFKLAENDFVNSTSHENAFQEATRIMDNFGLMVKRKAYERKVEEEEKILKNLEDDLEDLKDDKQDLENTITKAEQTIKESKEKLIQNKSDQETKVSELAEQQKALEKARQKFRGLK